MARLIFAIVAFALAIAVIKMVIVAIVVAGLVFRTKETLFLLLTGGLLAFLAAMPLVAVPLLAAAGVGGIVYAVRRNKAVGAVKLLDDPDQE